MLFREGFLRRDSAKYPIRLPADSKCGGQIVDLAPAKPKDQITYYLQAPKMVVAGFIKSNSITKRQICNHLDKLLIIIFQASLLLLLVTYFMWTHKKLIKISIGGFGIAVLGNLISTISRIQEIGLYSYGIFYFSAILIFTFHIIRTKNISNGIKGILWVIVLTALISYLFKVIHLPFYIFIRIFSIIPLGLIIFLNIKNIAELREELRMVDLLGIVMLIDFILYVNRIWVS